MSGVATQISFEPLQPAKSFDEYKIHLAAMEWSLADPIIITGREDIKSEVNWRGRFDPYDHQVENLIRFCRMLPVTLLADDVGLGKTISGGLVLAELIERKRVSRCLVVCPSILGPQWVEELDSKFNIQGKFAKGYELSRAISDSRVPVVVTTYQTASNMMGQFRSDQFEMLILDEAHKLRNLHGTNQPPQMATNIKSALEQRIFKYVMMLTATPIQNRIWDLYSLIDLLTTARGHQNPLGNHAQFASKYLADKDGRKLRSTSAEEFRSILRQYIVRTRREEARLKFPTRQVKTHAINGGMVEKQMEQIVAREIENLNPIVQISLSQAMMSSPHALASQLENMASRGTISEAIANQVRKLAEQYQVSAKQIELLRVVNELRSARPQDWRLIVFTLRKETQEAIGRELTRIGVPVGFIRGGDPRGNQSTVEAFRQTTPKINVIISTDAGAEGVNLQSGNVLINYDLPWNPMILEQRIGRIQRLGSRHENVIVINLVIAGSIEERVVVRLMQKLQAISESIGDIETILEAAEQDEEGSFEEMVRKLVVDSLVGQNVEMATALAAKSILDAKEKLNREKENIDAVFGSKGTEPEQGGSLPKLSKMSPSIPSEEFVRQALSAEGATITDNGDETYTVSVRGKAEELITFNPKVAERGSSGVFMGNAPRVYLPGRPPFERLVQRWLQRSAHVVRELSGGSDGAIRKSAAHWCSTVPGAEICDCDVHVQDKKFVGQMTIRAKAVNGVDSFERLIKAGSIKKDDLHGIPPEDLNSAGIIPELLVPTDVFVDIEPFIRQASVQDNSINNFCNHYVQRLNVEMQKANNDPRKSHRIKTNLEPKIFADVVGMTGVKYEIAQAIVRFELDKTSVYEAEIGFISGTQKIISEPERGSCEITGRMLPMVCLQLCAVSGKLATAHMLMESAVSGKRFLPEYAITCQATGDVLLEEEAGKSDLSGKIVRQDLLHASALSGRMGLQDELVTCEFSGYSVLRDEALQSEVSGKWYRHDEQAASTLSGKKGHRSEFVTCGETGNQLLADESGTSAVSGVVVSRDLLIASEKPPHRLGLKSELALCELSGKQLLKDEVVRSEVSGKWVDKDLVQFSEASGRAAVPEEFVRCEVSGQRLLPDEVGRSCISFRQVRKDLLVASLVSGRLATADEFQECQVTHAKVLPDELTTSEESGRKFRKDQVSISAESGRVGHISEMVTCDVTQKQVFASETSKSAVSGKQCLKSMLHASAKPPHRVGTEKELRDCAVTGKRLLIDEVIQSSVSDKWVDKDLAASSSVSGRMALPEELITCQESGKQLLPDESELCAITGKRVDRTLLAKSEVSGKIALSSKMERCAVSGSLALPSELQACDVTGKRVLPSELETCAVSHKRAIRYEFVVSDISGISVLPTYAIWSPITKRCCTPQEAAKCDWHDAQLPRDEVQVCRLTGLHFSKSVMNSNLELIPLRNLLDGKDAGSDANDLLGWIKANVSPLAGTPSSVHGISSPTGAVRSVCIEQRSMFGLRVWYAGLVLAEGVDRKILGRVMVGRRSRDGWKAES